tara:strand:- start:3318 stop:3893 length:576 start_codon:yes stop_codon:yes gene_type:complete
METKTKPTLAKRLVRILIGVVVLALGLGVTIKVMLRNHEAKQAQTNPENSEAKRTRAATARLGDDLATFEAKLGPAGGGDSMFTSFQGGLEVVFSGKGQHATSVLVKPPKPVVVTEDCTAWVAEFLPKDAVKVSAAKGKWGIMVVVYTSESLASALPDPTDYPKAEPGTFVVFCLDSSGETVVAALGNDPG